jgi:hypothetical protein
MNILYLGYDLIKDVAANNFSFKFTEDEEDEWDIIWCDHFITPNLLLRMKPH